jgi:cell division septal protein FtsQ
LIFPKKQSKTESPKKTTRQEESPEKTQKRTMKKKTKKQNLHVPHVFFLFILLACFLFFVVSLILVF